MLKQPIRVTAARPPWNFPAATVTRKAAPALAAGCAIVLKPAPQTPFSALALAECAIPPSLLNAVIGDAVKIGAALTGNPAVRKPALPDRPTSGGC